MTKDGIFRKLWIISVALFMLIIGVVFKSSIIQLVASISGVIYIALIATEKRIGYIFGIINVIFYSIVSYQQYLYGLVIYNMIYSLPVLIYGYIKWSNQNNTKVKTMSANLRLLTVCLIILLLTIYVEVGMHLGWNFGVTLTDGVSVIIGAIASFLMTKKYIEQWIGFITVNVTTIIYWLINSVGNYSNYIMVIMWVIYTINNIYGIILWNKSRKQQIENKNI